MPRTSEPFDGLYPDTENERADIDPEVLDVWRFDRCYDEAKERGLHLDGWAMLQAYRALVRENITPESGD